MQSNAFDEVLGLEEQFYDDGYNQGLTDGIVAGRIEGRTFGLEKAFEKYVDSGRLYGKSLVWANRMPLVDDASIPRVQAHKSTTPKDSLESYNRQPNLAQELPRLPFSARLTKNVKALHALSESDSLPTENTEEAVSEFDDRFKRALAKAKIIERMAGEAKVDSKSHGRGSGDGSIEDSSFLNARH